LKASEYQQLISEAAPKKGRYRRSPKEHRTLGGIVFDSVKEMHRWQELQTLEQAGEIFGLKRQQSYSIEINGQHLCKFRPDFEYTTKTGEPVIEEVKSTGTAKEPDYRLRKKAFELQYHCKVKELIR
jgi:hypothetical protein